MVQTNPHVWAGKDIMSCHENLFHMSSLMQVQIGPTGCGVMELPVGDMAPQLSILPLILPTPVVAWAVAQ